VQAVYAYNACMKDRQYTIRGVPAKLDDILRKRAVREGRSLNAELLETLKMGAGVGNQPPRYDDLDDLAGTWVKDPEFDRAIAALDTVDEALWK
jgi:hypothetical protein